MPEVNKSNIAIERETMTLPKTRNINENPLNLLRIERAENVPQESAWVALPYRIETAGYMSLSDTYLNTTQQFLDLLVAELGGAGNVGLVTSPTPFNGSIDYITTIVAHKAKLPLKYVTCEDYVQYIKPDEFRSSGIDIERYIGERKHLLPTSDEYLKGTSKVANAFLATGGRLDTINGFINAINNGNKVIILNNNLLGVEVWDDKKNRPNNAASYLAQKLAGNKTLPFIPERGFSTEFFQQNQEAIASLVKVVDINSASDILSVAKEAAEFLKS